MGNWPRERRRKPMTCCLLTYMQVTHGGAQSLGVGLGQDGELTRGTCCPLRTRPMSAASSLIPFQPPPCRLRQKFKSVSIRPSSSERSGLQEKFWQRHVFGLLEYMPYPPNPCPILPYARLCRSIFAPQQGTHLGTLATLTVTAHCSVPERHGY